MRLLTRLRRGQPAPDPTPAPEAVTRPYGSHVDVEVHEGRVVAVWVGCLELPFVHHEVTAQRANDLGGHHLLPGILSIEVARPQGAHRPAEVND